jgi:hypothetical protein
MKRRILTGMGLLLCLSFLVQAQTWDPVKRLTYTTGYSHSPVIAASGANVHVVWLEYNYGTYSQDLFYKKSTDYGATWSAPMRLTWGAYPSLPAIAVNATAVHIVYVQSGGDLIYRKSVDNGATWSRTQIAWGMYANYDLQMAVSGNFLHVVCVSWANSTYPVLYYKRSTDNGVTWSAPTNLGNGIDYAYYGQSVSIAASGANVHVVYLNNILHWGHFDMYYRRSTDNGATWSAPLQLASLKQVQLRENTDSQASAWSPSVAASGANVHVFYISVPEYGVYVYHELFVMSSTDNGMTWGSGKRLTWSYASYVASLSPKGSAVDGPNVYITYTYWATDQDIYFKKSTDGGATWSAPTRLTYLGNAFYPSMVYSPITGYFHIVLTFPVDNDTYYTEVYYKRGI